MAMRVVLTIDDKLGEKIEKAAAGEDLKRNDWIIKTISGTLSGAGLQNSHSGENEVILDKKNAEIRKLKDEVKLQADLREAYATLLDEKNNRIDDLKEEIARIEVLSITATDQINQDKDDRIKDLNRMIEHLQGQAAAHSLALQSAIRSKEKDDREDEDENTYSPEKTELIEKPKWMFWK